jgi:hypothetical protein
MKKGLIVLAITQTISIIVIVLLVIENRKKPEVIIKQGPVTWKPIKEDVTNKTRKELETNHNRYLTEKPWITAKQDKHDRSLIFINAGLCEREWNTEVSLKIKHKPALNIMSFSVYSLAEVPKFNFHYGIKMGYYRRLKPVYLGVDFIFSRNIQNNYGVGVCPTIVIKF